MKTHAALLGATLRSPQKLVSSVERHLLKTPSETRAVGVHPSAAAHPHWCRRASYYSLSGAEAEVLPRSLVMEMVFDTGHDAHRKWQAWFRQMGVLKGLWGCTECGRTWAGVSPVQCPACGQTKDAHIEYLEVPLTNKEYLLVGHADGEIALPDLGDPLIEIKTIGTGTLRYEAPELINKYTYTHEDLNGTFHTVTDWEALWRGIRRPFGSHLRQGMLYLFMSGKKSIHYIYEPKFVTAYPKEFVIKYEPSLIEDVLEGCLVVKGALAKDRPPKRPEWASPEVDGCKRCSYRSVCYETSRRPDADDIGAPVKVKQRNGKKRAKSAKPARVRFAEVTD